MEFITLIGIAVLLVLFNLYRQRTTFNTRTTQETDNEADTYPTNNRSYQNSYEQKYLMTLNEKAQYRKIAHWAKEHNLVVFSKVRMLDLVTPRKNQENYKGALWKIQAKHLDFVICDQDIRVKCIVEINDNSHNRSDRAERDTFVQEVLQSCGYKVLMTYNVTPEQLNQICGIADPIGENKQS